MSDEIKRPVSWDELFPNRFLKAGLMKGRDATLTIKDVIMEDMPDDKGVEKPRALMAFNETPKILGLNKTNAICLKAMFGANVREWVGKRVTLYPTKDKFGRETVDAIRVKGSPDLAADVTCEIKMPKKATRQVVLVRMVKKDAAPVADAPKPSESDGQP